jgi:DNA polymerase I-like protein with 3'-5' exonuclease and polymerase domains
MPTPAHVAFDWETCLIQPGIVAPQPVCLSWAREGDVGLVTAADAWPLLLGWLEDPQTVLVGARTTFDLGVALTWCPDQARMAEAIALAYAQRRIRDVQVRAKLVALAEGWLSFDVDLRKMPSFSLAALAQRYLGATLDKSADTWRLRYSELLGKAIHEYPGPAIDYAVMDAQATLDVYAALAERQHPPKVTPDLFTNEAEQTEADWFLALMSMTGLDVDPAGAAQLEVDLRASLVDVRAAMAAAGILRPNGTKDMGALRARVEAAYRTLGRPCPVTDKGATSTAADTLEGCGDALLEAVAEASSSEKLLSAFVPMLQLGIVNPSYDVLKESGRTSSYGPNIQQMPQGGGVRELFRPPPGHVFLDADYSTIELAALAQVCLDKFGRSRMAEAINAGMDLHVLTAAHIHRLDYAEALARYTAGDEELKAARKLAKVLNFGLPGGMGADSFVEYARGFGLDLDARFVQGLKSDWLQAYPEMQDYFHHLAQLAGAAEAFTLVQLRSGRVRAGCRYTSGCNSYFQGLAADGAKRAGCLLARRVLLPSGGPLYGCLLHAFVHDEFLISAPVATFREAATALEATMVEGMAHFIPDVAIRVDVTASDRWAKAARRIVDGDGLLQVWSPA